MRSRRTMKPLSPLNWKLRFGEKGSNRRGTCSFLRFSSVESCLEGWIESWPLIFLVNWFLFSNRLGLCGYDITFLFFSALWFSIFFSSSCFIVTLLLCNFPERWLRIYNHFLQILGMLFWSWYVMNSNQKHKMGNHFLFYLFIWFTLFGTGKVLGKRNLLV